MAASDAEIPETEKCPSEAELRRVASGESSGKESSLAIAHLESCRICQKSLQALRELTLQGGGDSATRTLGSPLGETSGGLRVENPAPVLEGYVLGRLLGRGGMGVVYEAWDLERRAKVAVKLLPAVEPGSLYRFKREFRARADLEHPSLVHLHELVAERDQWFFSMDLIDGRDFLSFVRGVEESATAEAGDRPATTAREDTASTADSGLTTEAVVDSLQENMSRQPRQVGGSCDQGRLVGSLLQLVDALDCVHGAGLLHRDVKPNNVMVDRTGRLILLDFGLVYEWDRPAPVETGNGKNGAKAEGPASDTGLAGTIGYMAPEQAAGGKLTPASDWYAVGVMVFEALTGRMPFDGGASAVLRGKERGVAPSPRQFVPEIASQWEQICAGLLERGPGRRLDSAGLRQLIRLLGGEGIEEPGEESLLEPAAAILDRPEPRLALERALAQVVEAGTPRLLLLKGPSGVGKSTLLRRFLDESAGRAIILRGRCYEQESLPYKAIDPIIDSLARLLRNSRTVGDAVQGPGRAALRQIFPVLGNVLEADEAQEGAVRDDGETRQWAATALGILLSTLALAKPVIIQVEDLQWGDLDSVSLLTELIRNERTGRVLLVASYRSEQRGMSECLRALEAQAAMPLLASRTIEMNVAPFTPEETQAYLEASPALDAAVHATVQRESRGNPLFVAELVRYLQGAGRGDESGLQLGDVLWRRIGELPENAKRLLEVMSVAVEPITQRVANEVAGLPEGERLAFQTLRRERLAKGTGPRLEDRIEPFHDQVRETVLPRVEPPVARQIHERLADRLAKEPGTPLETLGHHRAGAGDRQGAGLLYCEAAENAMSALAFDHSARLYRLALELMEPAPAEAALLERRLAHALASAGRAREAGELYLSCAALAQDEKATELLRRAGYNFALSGELKQARAAFDTILRQKGQRLHQTRAGTLALIVVQSLHLRLRGTGFRRRDGVELPREANEELETYKTIARGFGLVDPLYTVGLDLRCLRQALRLGDVRGVAEFLPHYAMMTGMGGPKQQARADRLLDQCRTLAAEVGDARLLARIEVAEGTLAWHLYEYRRSYEAMNRAENLLKAACRRTDSGYEYLACETYQIDSLYKLGQLQELAALRARRRTAASERGDLLALCTLDCLVGAPVRMAADQVEASRAEVDTIRRAWPPSSDKFLVAHINILAADSLLDLYDRKHERMLAELEARMPEMRKALLLLSQPVRLAFAVVRGRGQAQRVLDTTGAERRKMAALAERTAKRLDRERASLAQASAYTIRGAVQAALKDRKRASDFYAQAEEAYGRLEMLTDQLGARLARIHLAGGAEAAVQVDETLDEIRALGVVRPDRFAEVFSGYRLD